MDKIKSILRFLPVFIFIVAVIALFNSYGDMQKVRPADEYKDMGVYTFYPQRVIPLQKETNFSGKMKRRNPTTTVYAVDYWTEENRKNKLAAAAEKMPEPENWREKIEQSKRLRDKLRFLNEYNYILEKGGIESSAQQIVDEGKPVERRVLYIPEEKSYITVEKDMAAEDYVDEQIGFNKKVAMEFDSGWYLYTFFGNTGLSLSIKPDGITNECNWNSQTGDITGAAIKQALNSIAANPGFVSMPNGDIAEHIKSGDVIAGISGVWDVMNVKEAWGENYGACKLPTYTVAGKEVQMSSFTGYKMMGVNSYSKNKEWACRLADWLTNQQNQELRFKEKNQGPSNSKAAESDEIKKVAAIQAIIAQSQYGTLQRVGNSYWDACKKFANTVLSGNNGGLSDQEVMDTLVNEITASAVK